MIPVAVHGSGSDVTSAVSESPVSATPYELLEIIFSYAVCIPETNFFPDSFASLALSHVCRFWRFFAQSSPRLWTINLSHPDTHYLRLVRGSGTPLNITCSSEATRAQSWPNWLYLYMKNEGLKSLSVNMYVDGLERFLKIVSEDLPGLEALDLHACMNWSKYCTIRLDNSLPFLRSLTIFNGRAAFAHQNILHIPTLDLVRLLRLCPSLEILRLEYIHLDDVSLKVARLEGRVDKEATLSNLREWKITGTNCLNSILELVTVPSTLMLALHNMGLSGDLTAVTKRRLREARHTHLSITTTTVETSDWNSRGVYRFSGLRNYDILFHALISYGRAFRWSARLRYSSLTQFRRKDVLHLDP